MYPWLDLYAPYVAAGALAIAVVCLLWAVYSGRKLRALQAHYDRLTAGTGGGSLEQVLDEHLDNVRSASERASAAWETATQVERQGRRHLQHVGLVRYNPFTHTGGDQSFALALVDADGNGAVVNSLHSRDGTRIYAKPIAGWQSAHALTKEEEEAIAKARGQG